MDMFYSERQFTVLCRKHDWQHEHLLTGVKVNMNMSEKSNEL